MNTPFTPNSPPFMVAGTFTLFVCWLFFNGGSGYGITNQEGINSPQKIIMNTILSGSSGGISIIFVQPLF